MNACTRCAELQSAYDDFQAQSKEFEGELEAELTAANQQLDTLKAKLDKSNSTLASERESGKTSLSQLHSQVASLQSELTKTQALVENLKAAKRTLELAQSDFEQKLRRAEAAAADATEKADHHAEKAVMLTHELEEHVAMHNEYEIRTRSELKEQKEELQHAKRQAEAAASSSGGAPAATAAPAPAAESTDTAGLQEEIALLQEEKQQLNQDIEEVTTDLTNAQDENEQLTAQVEELKAQLASTATAAPAVATPADAAPPTSLPADLALIATLQAKVVDLESARLAAEEAQQQANAELDAFSVMTQTQLAALMKQLTASKAHATTLEKELADAATKHAAEKSTFEKAAADHHANITKLEQDVKISAALESQLASLTLELKQTKASLATSKETETLLTSQITNITLELASSQSAHSSLSASAAQTTELGTKLTQLTLELETLRSEHTAQQRRHAHELQAATDAQSKLAAEHAEHEQKLTQRYASATEATTKRTRDLEGALSAAEAQLSVLRATQDQSSASADSQVQTLTSQLLALTAERQQVQTQLQIAQDAAAATAVQLTHSDASLTALRAQLAHEEQASSVLKAQVQTAEATVAAQQSEFDAQLAAAKLTHSTQLELLNAQLSDAQSLQTATEAQLNANEAKRVQLECDAIATAAPAPPSPRESELNSTVTLLKREKSGLMSQVADLTSQTSHFSEQFSAWELEKHAMQQQLDLQQEEITLLQAQQQINLSTATPIKPIGNGTHLDDSLANATDLSLSFTPQPYKDDASSSTFSPSPSFSSSFTSPSPPVFSLGASAVSRDRFDADNVSQLQALLRQDLDHLQVEVSRLDSTTTQVMQPVFDTLQTDVVSSLQMLASLQSNLASSTDREQDLMGKLQQTKGSNIRVFCRVRPIQPSELAEAREENLLQYPSEQQVSIRADVAKRNRTKLAESFVPGQKAEDDSAGDLATPAVYTPFNFDRVFGPQTTQEEVYESVEDMVLPVLNGFRGCIFAYGQTGSGKTHTMGALEGDGHADGHAGIIFRSLQTLFRGVANRGSAYKYELRLSLLELYNENWQDLLEGATVGEAVTEQDETVPDVADDADDAASQVEEEAPEAKEKGRSKLVARAGVNGMYIDGASRRVVSNVSEVLTLLKHGAKMRHVESTNMNEQSSRSHLVMIVDVVGVNQATQVTSRGRLSLIDLAGSERVKASGSSGARLVEATHINRSLSSLADVFTALVDPKSKHIPFRNSKLTHLLQGEFSGSSKTLMFVTLSPAAMHAGETLCSLQFAVRARQVRLNRAHGPNLDGLGHKYKTMLEQQQSAFAAREKAYLAQLKQLKALVKGREKTIETLTAQIKALQDRLTETDRKLERSEAERRAAANKPSSPTSKDRKAELDEDRKWNSLQNDLAAHQTRAAESKAHLDRVQNEWRDKYSSLESKLKEQLERMRVQRIEWAEKRGVPVDDEADDSAEVAALKKQVGLLDLEVTRLKLARNASLRTERKGSLVVPGQKSSTIAESPETPTNGIATKSDSAPPSSLLRMSSLPATPGSPQQTSRIASTVRNLSSIPASTTTTKSSALLAARQAAMLAQKRALESQSSSLDESKVTRSRSASTSGNSVPSSRSSSNKAKRLSKLPGPKVTTRDAASPASSPTLTGLSGADLLSLDALDDGAADPDVVSSEVIAPPRRVGAIALPMRPKGHIKTGSSTSTGSAGSASAVAPVRSGLPTKKLVAVVAKVSSGLVRPLKPKLSPPVGAAAMSFPSGSLPDSDASPQAPTPSPSASATSSAPRSMLRPPTSIAFTASKK